MTAEASTPRELGAHELFVGVDCSYAGTTGIASAVLQSHAPRRHVGRTLVERLTGTEFYIGVQVETTELGAEMEVARRLLGAGAMRRVTLVLEAQYMAKNAATTAKLIVARTRWAFAFELVAREIGIPIDFEDVPPSTWQAAWLGIASASGRTVLKTASEIAARHALGFMRHPEADTITGDAADALNLLLWRLSRGLNGLARKFGGAKPKPPKPAKPPAQRRSRAKT